ncbi:MAG: recombination mediator RecR [Firmicutes bacterium]|nr:recombination mediator RecR [Bacillota bacterium]MCD7747514.1 recombination mediator RecR [Bacillota bacterium]MCD7788096.1 recombination mediator RecR [Bacillota bacterium]MCD7831995.1 recombination mediator RecR [Bacillota bacterium]MCD8315113.1 recombination mediator RecR [Bacillota bacterium]
MSEYIEPIERLSEMFRRLPGVGKKSAVRMAFCVLEMTDEDARAFSDAILSAKEKVKKCSVCGNMTDGDVCSVCRDPERDKSLICVVENSRDVVTFERVREYKGLYHVLGGVISPVRGIGPSNLSTDALLRRLSDGGVREVIIATNPTVEGETTALYISKLVAPLGVKATRLAYGVPVGSDLEYADEVTLNRAIEGRREIN